MTSSVGFETVPFNPLLPSDLLAKSEIDAVNLTSFLSSNRETTLAFLTILEFQENKKEQERVTFPKK